VSYYKAKCSKSRSKGQGHHTSNGHLFCHWKWNILPSALLTVAPTDHRGGEPLDILPRYGTTGSLAKGTETTGRRKGHTMPSPPCLMTLLPQGQRSKGLYFSFFFQSRHSTTWAHLQSLCSGYFEDGGLLNYFCPGWPWIFILLISASQVGKITGVSHQCPPLFFFFYNSHSTEYVLIFHCGFGLHFHNY
jgi:hypothetical protein